MATLQQPAEAGPDSLCRLVLPALIEQGFTPATLRRLAERPVLIRHMLARSAAHLELTAELEVLEDPLEASCPVFRLPVTPLPLQPPEWLEYIEERNRSHGARRCDIATGPGYIEDPVFRLAAPRLPSQLLLVETANGQRDLAQIEESANQLAPGCLAQTRPRSIFEVLRQIWGRLNDLNAAYVMVASRDVLPGTPLPIIFNPPQGNIRLGFVRQLPRNSGYTGYVAFCAA